MGACKTQGIKTDSKYYFKDIQDEMSYVGNIKFYFSNFGPNDAQNDSLEQRVSLICSLKNVDSSNEFKIELIFYYDNKRKSYESGAFTETRKKDINNLISFEQFFAIPYFFERQQLLDFKIYNGKHFETIQTTLGSIMGSRNQILIKKLPEGTNQKK